jgi:hypothetical protein
VGCGDMNIIVDIQRNTLEYYNSYGLEISLPDRVNHFANSLLWFFRVFRGVELNFSQVIMRPQQLNGTDCGLFVILYGLLRSSGWDSQKIHHELKMTHAQKMRQKLKLWCSTFEKMLCYQLDRLGSRSLPPNRSFLFLK